MENRCNVVRFFAAKKKPCSRVLDQLQFTSIAERGANKQRIAIVQARSNKCMQQDFKRGLIKVITNTVQIAELKLRGFTKLSYMVFKRKRVIKNNPKIFCNSRERHSSIPKCDRRVKLHATCSVSRGTDKKNFSFVVIKL